MKKTNTAAAAARVAAADNKTNNAANLDRAAILNAAKDAAAGCNTCKEVAAKFPALCDKYGKETALLIQSAAKAIVTDHKTTTAAAAAAAIGFLKDGAKVARAAWDALCQDKDNGPFARIIYERFGRDLDGIVVRFASYIGTIDGRKVAAVKHTREEDGAKVAYYVPRDLSKVGGYLAALKLAIRNAKREALGAKLSAYQAEINF